MSSIDGRREVRNKGVWKAWRAEMYRKIVVESELLALAKQRRNFLIALMEGEAPGSQKREQIRVAIAELDEVIEFSDWEAR